MKLNKAELNTIGDYYSDMWEDLEKGLGKENQAYEKYRIRIGDKMIVISAAILAVNIVSLEDELDDH